MSAPKPLFPPAIWYANYSAIKQKRWQCCIAVVSYNIQGQFVRIIMLLFATDWAIGAISNANTEPFLILYDGIHVTAEREMCHATEEKKCLGHAISQRFLSRLMNAASRKNKCLDDIFFFFSSCRNRGNLLFRVKPFLIHWGTERN